MDLRRHLLSLALGLCACSLDERQLELASGDGGDVGMAGTSSVEEPDASGGSGGEGASAFDSAPSGLVEGCADLDTDGIADCTTTLVKNPSFPSDVNAWEARGDTRLAWDSKNALADLPSGSARLVTSASRASVLQCVPVDGARLIIAYANAFVVPAGDASDSSHADLEVSFFDGVDCGGSRNGYFETPPSTVTGEWTTIQAGGLSNPTTHSVAIALVAIRSASAPEVSVHFDNVMLKAKAP